VYVIRPLLELIGPLTLLSGKQSFIRAGFVNIITRGLNTKILILLDLSLLLYEILKQNIVSIMRIYITLTRLAL
jgi:hypothetical protein